MEFLDWTFYRKNRIPHKQKKPLAGGFPASG